MFRLRHTLVSGFPRLWLIIRMPCSHGRSPLVTPDVRISRIRRSQIPSPQAFARSCADVSQVDQTLFLQMTVRGLPLGNSIRPLAPPTQMSRQPIPYKPVDLPKLLPRVPQPEVVGPTSQVYIQPTEQLWQRQKAPPMV